MGKLIDLNGTKFGRLTVIRRHPKVFFRGKQPHIVWICQCDCGTVVERYGVDLRTGDVKSCGCIRKDAGEAYVNKAIQTKGKSTKLGRGVNTGHCEGCGKDITDLSTARILSRRFCSKQCASHHRRRRVFITCFTCGAVVERLPYDAKQYRKKYCSSKCQKVGMIDDFSQFRVYLIRARGRAERLPVCPMKLTLKDLKDQWDAQGGICPYTGWELVQGKGKFPRQASLDRIDSSKGYVQGNVQFVALIANYAKNKFSTEDLVSFCNAVVQHQSMA